MELILYYIKESKSLLLSFLILIFVLGIFLYISMRNFRQDKKSKVFFYGLFLGMKNIDILKIAIIVIRCFVEIYAIFSLNQFLMWLSIIMILILSISYIIISHKKIIYEIATTNIIVIMIYFIFIIGNYQVEAGSEYMYIKLMLKIALMLIVSIIAIYTLLKDTDVISENRVKQIEKNYRKRKQLKSKVKLKYNKERKMIRKNGRKKENN